ncbi:MAG: hypothetical protein MUP52_01335 [Candidatus Aminicenantes bacterium]|nr:hypothetical protein [Candidatus Aminicenantes bacterium]
MLKVPRIFRLVLFLFFAIGVALFLQFRSQVPTFTIINHKYDFTAGPVALCAAPVFIFLLGFWALISSILGKICGISYNEGMNKDFPTYFPLLFFALTPLVLIHYLMFDDLQRRLGLFLLAVLFSVFYLKAVQVAHVVREKPTPWLIWMRKFFSLPLRRQALLLFVAALLIYNGGSLLIISNGIFFSGDEPHYLLITHSLLKDGDFDLANNYAQNDYARYLPAGATIRAHVVPGTKPGALYSFHSPGLSFLLLPFYALGLWLGKSALLFLPRFGMSLFGALLGVQMYLFARQEWKRDRLALGLWILFSFTSPVFFYSIHVYPEIIVALFAFTVFRWLRFSATLSKPRLLLCGFLMSSFIWFHALKYFFILAPLFAYALWVLIKKHKARLDLAYVLVLPVVNVLLYFYFQYSLYGSLNPTSVSWQGAMDAQQTVGFLKTLLTGIPFRFRLETLLGYFLDQRDGLLFYAPIYFFAFLGLLEMAKRKVKDFCLLLFITGPYIFVSAFLTQRTGYAPQARPVVAVVWGLAIFVGYFLAHNRKKLFAYLMDLAIGFSLLFVGLLCLNPVAIYQETTIGATERGGKLFYILSHLHFYLPNVLPSFLKVEEWRWRPNFIWPVILLVFIAAYILVRKHAFLMKFSHHLALALLGLAFFFVWFVFYPRITLVPIQKTVLPTGEKIAFYALSRVARMTEPAKFALLEDNRDYHFYFTTKKPIEKLKVEYGSSKGDYELRLVFFDEPEFDDTTRREIKDRILESPPAYRWKKFNLYRLGIHLEKKSDVQTGLNPYHLEFRPVR